MEKLDWHWLGLKVSPYDDVIDTRTIVARIEEIESEQITGEGDEIPPAEWPDDIRDEHRVLLELAEEIGEIACRDGVTLVRDSHFAEHIQDEFLEIGPEYHEQDPNVRWHSLIPVSREELFSRDPFKFIDWDAVAEDHWSNYSQVEFLGTTYLYLEP